MAIKKQRPLIRKTSVSYAFEMYELCLVLVLFLLQKGQERTGDEDG
jgi:hypothetical protein